MSQATAGLQAIIWETRKGIPQRILLETHKNMGFVAQIQQEI